MNIFKNEQFIKRLKSFLWRSAGMTVVGFIGFLISPEIAAMIGLPALLVTGGGLLIGEITKAMNKNA